MIQSERKMELSQTKKWYVLMVIVAAAFIVHVVYNNFIHDSEAASFLSHKPELPPDAWLAVMRIHVVFACISMIAGAVNFSSAVLKKYRKLHRWIGYLYVVSVLLVVLTSGYMAPHATGGKASSMAFNLLNLLWAFLTVMAVIKIKKKQIMQHRQWMSRSYAFVFTNMVIHLLTALLQSAAGLGYGTSYTIAVYGSIILLLLAAELVNRTVFRKPATLS